MNVSHISPKVYLPFLISLLCAVVLWRITGDDTFLVGILVSFAGGAAGYRAEPAPRVSQAEVNQLSRDRVPKLGRPKP